MRKNEENGSPSQENPFTDFRNYEKIRLKSVKQNNERYKVPHKDRISKESILSPNFLQRSDSISWDQKSESPQNKYEASKKLDNKMSQPKARGFGSGAILQNRKSLTDNHGGLDQFNLKMSKVSMSDDSDEFDKLSMSEVPFLIEPPNDQCIKIQSLEDELNQVHQRQFAMSTREHEYSDAFDSSPDKTPLASKKNVMNDVDSQRPDKVYMRHCQMYSEQQMEKYSLRIDNYMFKPEDIQQKLLSPIFFERLRQRNEINIDADKLSQRDLQILFRTESMKLFSDYIFNEGTLMMVIKTWQKVVLYTPKKEARFELGESMEAFQLDKCRDQAGLLREELFTSSNHHFYIKTVQVFDKFGQPISPPILVEQVFGTFDSFRIYDTSFLYHEGQLIFFKRQFLDKDEKKKLKQEQLWTAEGQQQKFGSQNNIFSSNFNSANKFKQGQIFGFIVEKINQDSAFANNMVASTQTRQPSDLKKSFGEAENAEKQANIKPYLQLYSLDLETGTQNIIYPVYIQEDDWDEAETTGNVIRTSFNKNKVRKKERPSEPFRSQYNIHFSVEFGPKSSHEFQVNYKDLWDYLSNQYFSVQKYVTGQGQEYHPFRLFKVGDFSANLGRLHRADNNQIKQKMKLGLPQYLVANSNQNQQHNINVDLNRQIQYLNHIRNYHNDKQDHIDFLIQNMFYIVGINVDVQETGASQLFKQDNKAKFHTYKRKTIHQYQRIWNIGGIIPQMAVLKHHSGSQINQSTFKQYYFVDSRNNIQLLFPNLEAKLDRQRRIEDIRDIQKFSNKYHDYLVYKKIAVQRISDGQCQCKNVFQNIDHLQYILGKSISCSQSFNFFEDRDHQMLYLTESKSREVIFFKMKDERQEICPSISKKLMEDSEMAESQVLQVMRSSTFSNGLGLQKQKTSARFQMIQLQKSSQKETIREEVCDIDNQTFQALKAKKVTIEDVNSCNSSFFYEVLDKDHDEPYCQCRFKSSENTNNIIPIMGEDGYGILKLKPAEKRNYCLIDDFNGQKKKVKMFNFFDSQQLRLIKYVQANHGEFCLFVFAVYNPEKNFDLLGPQDHPLIKRSYIFVRKNHYQMEKIFASNGNLEIIRTTDDVVILKNWKQFDIINFSQIKHYQFQEKQQQDYSPENLATDMDNNPTESMILRRNSNQNRDLDPHKYRDLSITVCQYQDDDSTQINFLPFIYQEKNNSENNKLIVFDIFNNEPTQILSMNPYDKEKDYLYEDANGYNKFMLCRSSDLYEQNSGQKILANQSNLYSKVKFQVFTLYSEKLGRLHCEEFIISHDSSFTKVETIGLKEILFSNKIISTIKWDTICQSQVLPYLDDFNCCKGCKIKLVLGPSQNNAVWLNMIDGENSNIYFYKSQIVLCGSTKMILSQHDTQSPSSAMFVTLTACMLRKNIISKSIFNRSQAFDVLSLTQDLLLRMKVPNLEYLVLNSFDEVLRKDFFRTQVLLQGKSLADISLSSTESWREALQSFRQERKILDSCVVENIIEGDEVRREHMQHCEFYPNQCIVQFDLNLMGTIERGFKLNSFKSLKLIFTHILDVIDTFEYHKFIMYELPILIEQKQIQIDDFYNLSQSERKNTDKGFCNLELELSNQELPPFTDQEFDSFKVEDFTNFKQIENEITDEIWNTDQKKGEMGVKDSDKKFETEYFYIDYHYMILGEKMRDYRQRKPQQEFNDLLFAKIIAQKVGESQRNSFFIQETIQKIIDSQWTQTKTIQKYIFLIYVVFYCIPMGMSCFQFMDSLMFNIAIWPACILLLIELIQLREQGLEYFIGWNLIDGTQLAIFGILYYMRYMGEDREVLYFPELKFVNIILTFLKLMFFVRIFEDYGYLVQMIILCMQDLVPFFMTYLLFLNFFSMCFILLNCDIDGEISGTPVLTHYQLMLLQVYRTALGELAMPGYSQNDIWSDENRDHNSFLNINKQMIWILWYISTFFMFVIMTNFNIAQITSTFERVRGLEKKISFELKAEMNHETYMLLSIFTTLKNYRCIIFANTKNSQNKSTEALDEQYDQLKRAIVKNNNTFDEKHEDHSRSLKKLTAQEDAFRHQLDHRMKDILKEQDKMNFEVIFAAKKKLNIG